ncbi:MAG: acetoacetyl-CoA reductase [Rhodomicrobium sp.]|jgi:acetoacetyl-CoA reductase
MSKVAIVTGGTRGIGRAISIELKDRGYAVAANYGGNDEAASKYHEETGIPVFKWDVGDYEACAAGVKQVEEQLGPISVLVNNAGITRDAVLHKMTPQQWKDVIHTDLESVFNMTRNVINGMRDRNYGRIISISSVNGQKGQIGQSNYAAAKAGIIAFSRTIAAENAKKGITVNVVAPGYINTEMVQAVPEKVLESIIAQIPIGRLGRAEEIAKCVAFLAGDEVGFITGSTISANGGQYFVG